MKRYIRLVYFLPLALLLMACPSHDQQPNKPGPEKSTESLRQSPVPFNADSTFDYIEKQVAYGPRVPGTKAHEACAKYLETKLRQYVQDVTVQTGDVKAYDGTILHIKNIIGVVHPEKHKKILICAHWDSRPWADEDSVDKKKPIDAANDAASGIAIMLEMARELQNRNPDIGVVLLMQDAEDYGVEGNSDSYALGAQYWAKSLDKTKLIADYGILLDMVGAKDARFLQEEYSLKYANDVVVKVWNQAQLSGASNYFINNHTGAITDDHVPINELGIHTHH